MFQAVSGQKSVSQSNVWVPQGFTEVFGTKKINTYGLLSIYFLTSKCHIQPDFGDGAPLKLQTHAAHGAHQVIYFLSG
jgi:hypothetical protein